MQTPFDSIREKLEDTSGAMWELLRLERDVTMHRAHPERFAPADKNEALTRYRTVSMNLFGEVRQDRR